MGVFKTLTKTTKEVDTSKIDARNYEKFLLNALEDKSTFTGEPFLTEVYENEFQDYNDPNKTIKKYSANLYINNHETKEKLKARVNLKNLKDEITVWKNSVAYDIIDSIEELNEPGTSGINNVYTISFKELQNYINSLKSMSIRVKEHNGDILYNTLRVTRVEVRDQ